MNWGKASERENSELFTVKDPTAVATEKDKADLDNRHAQLLERLQDEKSRQSENRYQMAVDEDYYDSMQWTEDDARELMERGQAPLVFNKIKPTINWILGTEKRTRFDYNVLPRASDDEKQAEVKKKLMKYVADANRLQFHRSNAFKDAVIAGLGWLEEGISADPTDEMLTARAESWRNVFHDSRSRESDCSDMRYIIRTKVVDLDMAKAMFPDKCEALSNQGITGFEDQANDVWYLGERLTNQRDFDSAGNFNGATGLGQRGAFVASGGNDIGRRDQIRINEGWYTVPMPVKYFAEGDMRGKQYDASNQEHKAAAYRVPLVSAVRNQMRVMLFTESTPLWDGPSPYSHNRFPFTPVWAYRRARDGMPYGVVRDIRDPQEDLNKRRSKALFILSANRVVMDKGAVDDIEDVRIEAARPDAMIIKNPNKELRFEKPAGEFQGNLEMMQNAENFIQEVSGVTSENLGQSTNATSGKAILARQEQGSIVTATLFDNLRFAVQCQGEKILALMEQFYTAPKVVRIVGDNAPVDWVTINTPDATTGEMLNDIAANHADFIVSEQDFRASLRQAAQETMTQLMQTLPPEVSISMLDLVVDLWDLPNKEEWLQRIRKVNGQRDPAKKPTPEEEQQAMAMQQQQQAQQQMQMEGVMAEIDLKKAQATKMGAEAKVAIAGLQAPQGSPELEQAAQELQALNQQLAEVSANADKLIYESKIKADDRVRELNSRIEEMRVAGASKSEEIIARKDAEIEKARITRDGVVESARIQADASRAVDQVMGQLDDLRKQLADMGIEHQKTQQDHAKEMTVAAKDGEKVVGKLEQSMQDLIAAFNQHKKELADDAKADKAEQKTDKPDAKPAQPITLNVTIDGKGAVTKEIVLTKDKDGNTTGGKVIETPTTKE